MIRRQKGMHIVEFAAAGSLFLLLLLGAIEFARMLFMWNTLAEATQRGAHIAAVCPQNSAAIENAVRFIPALMGNGTVTTSYIDDGKGHIIAVRVTLSGYRFDMNIPYFFYPLTAPDFSTQLPVESLGAWPGSNCP
jgi:Flp pilus assembly protein TadG